MDNMLTVASSPHIRSGLSTQKVMLLVIASLVPAGAAGVCFLGIRSLAVIAICVITCVACEAIWQKLSKQSVSVCDLSAALTGLLLAYNVPPEIPLWMCVAGGAFSIIIVKQFFGGLGCNIMNPALAGRAMMLICWPVAMTTWNRTPLGLDRISGPTPLAILKSGEELSSVPLPSLWDLFIGNVGGCIGETSALALLAGGAFLIFMGIISWRIPVVYIATVAAMAALLGRSAGPVYEICAGGLMLGAFFMATDYSTSPMTPKGQIIFAFGCGIIASLIRTFGGYPEGVSYSILIMNLAVPLIDRATAPRIFGTGKAVDKDVAK